MRIAPVTTPQPRLAKREKLTITNEDDRGNTVAWVAALAGDEHVHVWKEGRW
jgi:hypothetical protein